MSKKTDKKGPVVMTQDSDAVPETAGDVAAPPAQIEQLVLDDLRVLQLSFKELENLVLKHRVAQMELENLAKAAETARAELTRLNEAVNVKYKLDPAKDRINIQNGQITRGAVA